MGAASEPWIFYISYLGAELLQFRIACARRARNPGREYLYLGAPAIFGLLCLARRRGWRDVMPLLAMGGVTAVVVTNPFGLVLADLSAIPPCWFRLPGIGTSLRADSGVAPLAAMGLDHCLRQSRRPRGNWLACLAIALLAGWSVARIDCGAAGQAGFPVRLGVGSRSGDRSGAVRSRDLRSANPNAARFGRAWPPSCC